MACLIKWIKFELNLNSFNFWWRCKPNLSINCSQYSRGGISHVLPWELAKLHVTTTLIVVLLRESLLCQATHRVLVMILLAVKYESFYHVFVLLISTDSWWHCWAFHYHFDIVLVNHTSFYWLLMWALSHHNVWSRVFVDFVVSVNVRVVINLWD